jgi:hypothetical protein
LLPVLQRFAAGWLLLLQLPPHQLLHRVVLNVMGALLLLL